MDLPEMGRSVEQADIASGLVMAVSHHLRLLLLARRLRGCHHRRRQHRGSVRGRAPNKKRDFGRGCPTFCTTTGASSASRWCSTRRTLRADFE